MPTVFHAPPLPHPPFRHPLSSTPVCSLSPSNPQRPPEAAATPSSLLAAALAGAAPASRITRVASLHVAPGVAVAVTTRRSPLTRAAAAALVAALPTRSAAAAGRNRTRRAVAVVGGAQVGPAVRRWLAGEGVELKEVSKSAGVAPAEQVGGQGEKEKRGEAGRDGDCGTGSGLGDVGSGVERASGREGRGKVVRDSVETKVYKKGTAPFRLVAPYPAAGSQPHAIDSLVERLSDRRFVTCAGATGVGKTFVMANVIARVGKPSLILAPNKLLAAQLCDELRQYFPFNSVNLFVSYYKHFVPESFLPNSDTYIAKSSSIDSDIDRLRHLATRSIVERKDCIIVASVSAIYGLGLPVDYLRSARRLVKEEVLNGGLDSLVDSLKGLRYVTGDEDAPHPSRGEFRVRGAGPQVVVEIGVPWEQEGVYYAVDVFRDAVTRLRIVRGLGSCTQDSEQVVVYPASHFVSSKERTLAAIEKIQEEKSARVRALSKRGAVLEAQRLEERVEADVEMLKKVGFCSGIENYSMHLTGRSPGEAPDTLLDFFPDDGEWLLFCDESHVTVPQLSAMYAGNLSRKQQLVRHGFRLPSALENRPLRADEFWRKVPQAVFVSATPSNFELHNSAAEASSSSVDSESIEQLAKCGDDEDSGFYSGKVDAVIRPTGVLDPEVEVVPTAGQVDHLVVELAKVVAQGERAIVTTLTKKSAEDLAVHLRGRPPVVGVLERQLAVSFLHSGISSVERMEVLDAMRSSESTSDGDSDSPRIDVLVGVNLLREGISLPSVSLVCITDADKEGFLRSTSALIQTIGRAARNVNGKCVLYADKETKAMKEAIKETRRRRRLQMAYNARHGIAPTTVVGAKDVKDDSDVETLLEQVRRTRLEEGRPVTRRASTGMNIPDKSPNIENVRDSLVGFSEAELEAIMDAAVDKELFEYAAEIRDYISTLS